LTEYKPFDDLERVDLESFRAFVARYGPRIYDYVPGQPFITASAIVLNPASTKTLVQWHNLHKQYRQWGGKANPATVNQILKEKLGA